MDTSLRQSPLLETESGPRRPPEEHRDAPPTTSRSSLAAAPTIQVPQDTGSIDLDEDAVERELERAENHALAPLEGQPVAAKAMGASTLLSSQVSQHGLPLSETSGSSLHHRSQKLTNGSVGLDMSTLSASASLLAPARSSSTAQSPAPSNTGSSSAADSSSRGGSSVPQDRPRKSRLVADLGFSAPGPAFRSSLEPVEDGKRARRSLTAASVAKPLSTSGSTSSSAATAAPGRPRRSSGRQIQEDIGAAGHGDDVNVRSSVPSTRDRMGNVRAEEKGTRRVARHSSVSASAATSSLRESSRFKQSEQSTPRKRREPDEPEEEELITPTRERRVPKKSKKLRMEEEEQEEAALASSSSRSKARLPSANLSSPRKTSKRLREANDSQPSSSSTRKNGVVGRGRAKGKGGAAAKVESEILESTVAASPKRFGKRIKVSRRPAVLSYTSPFQVPRAPVFGRSITALWSSYTQLSNEEISPEQLAKLEMNEVALRKRIDALRNEGLLPSDGESRTSTRLRPQEPPRSRSHHDHLMSAAVAQAAQFRHDARHRTTLARKTARMIAVYWEKKLGTGLKAQKAEERRIRALAKWTVREVLKQWKLAANVVRARKNAAIKQYNEKRGRAQLNAILEQSTQMLEMQHADLTRADSNLDDSEMLSNAEDDEDNDEEEKDSSEEDNSEDSQQEEDGSTDPGDGSDEDASLHLAADDADTGAKAPSQPVNDSEAASSRPKNVPSFSLIIPSRASTKLSSGPASYASGPRSESESAESEILEDEMQEVRYDRSGPSSPVNDAQTEIVHSVGDTVPIESESPKVNGLNGTHEPAASTARVNGRQIKPNGKDFLAHSDEHKEREDADLERKMWEEDEEDEEEDDGLLADADIPIEELLKKYGYGDGPGSRADDTNEEVDSSEEEEDAESEESEEGEGSVADTSTSLLRMPGERTTPSPKIVELNNEVAKSDDASNDADAGDVVGTFKSKANGDRAVQSMRPPFLLRGKLRPYQQIGFEWLASLYSNGVNGILADEMGLGKTIQTISLLAHLACDKGVWGPHLVVAPTSVMLNWEVEFKKFLPGFKILSYYGSQKERKEKRIGWNTEGSFNVCITSYQLVLADQHILRRKPWVYLVLDEAHHIKNFRSQRWQTLLGFNSQRRLLLTGTPLQNNLMDLWSLMYFLMPQGLSDVPGGGAFANMKDFQDWFSNPLDKAIESGERMDDETRAMVSKLHTVLRPYILRRLKADVEKELPHKFEHVITCRLSKRQRFLYNDFMSRAKTRDSLASGNYLSIINCLMQLRKVCNHPDLFEVRPIVTSFAMQRSVVADFEIQDLLVRRRLLKRSEEESVNLTALNLVLPASRSSHLLASDIQQLDASHLLLHVKDPTPALVPLDTWTVDGYQRTIAQRRHVATVRRWKHKSYLNTLHCQTRPVYGTDLVSKIQEITDTCKIVPYGVTEPDRRRYLDRCDLLGHMILSYDDRRAMMQDVIDRFACATPRAMAVDMPRWALPGLDVEAHPEFRDPALDTIHPVAVKLNIAFPDASLLQYDCGKLQQLDILMRRLKAGGHRILIFTQMTKVLDILEAFLNYHGYLYMRLDGATKVEQRQVLTERFNRDPRIDAFILSTRSGGLGINLTGADTVLFYDLDWNAAIEAQCMDRAHRIGQTRDVHIYRFVSEHTIEENMLRKANQKRMLDNMVIQEGEFNTDTLGRNDWRDMLDDGGTIAGVRVAGASIEEEGAEEGGTAATAKDIERAFLAAEDEEDAAAARVAQAELYLDSTDFAAENKAPELSSGAPVPVEGGIAESADSAVAAPEPLEPLNTLQEEDEEEEGGTVDDYILKFVELDWEHFSTV